MTRKIPSSDTSRNDLLHRARRSHKAVARRNGASRQTVTKHANQESGQKPLAFLERKRLGQLRLLRDVQEKALEALSAHPFTNAMDAVLALDMAITLERQIRCQPSRRSVRVELTGARRSH